MKSLFITLLLFSGVAQVTGQALSYTDEDGHKQLWGPLTAAELWQAPFEKWQEEYNAYSPTLPPVDLKAGLMGLQVDLYLGTWCGDSQAWVPRFLKLWAQLGLPEAQIRLIGLHQADDKYKQGPAQEEKGLNIHRVPTFIFKRNGQEVGRIVERPLNSLELDLAQLALGVPSKPRYRAASYLHEQFKTQPLDSLYAQSRSIMRSLNREVAGPSELNTYGYVLKSAGQLQEALFAFLANNVLFRFDPNTYDSLGEMYYQLEDKESAKACYERVLELRPNDENATAMLAKIAGTAPVDSPDH